MQNYFWWILLVLAFLGCQISHAQRHPERMMLFNPLEKSLEKNDRSVQWLPGFYGTGSFGKYIGPKDADHEWHHKMGLAFEILRWNNKHSLAGITQAEFIYDRNNSINFNPRATFWEEGLIYTRAFKNFDLQLTYLHRCKHDIDNLDVGTQRSTINSSLGGKLLFREWSTGFSQLRIAPGIDFYTTTYDNRKPDKWDNERLNWEKMAGALNLNFVMRKNLGGAFNFFLSGYSKLALFSNKTDLTQRYAQINDARFSGAAFSGIEVNGQYGIRIGLHYERLADTGIPVSPKSASLLSIAVQAMNRNVFY